MSEKPTVVRVLEGPAHRSCRTFSVVLSAPTGDLSIVAGAVDPAGTAIPSAGQVHPLDESLVARPPMIYPVGLRDAGGVVLKRPGRFFNVRVPYVKRGG